MTTRKLIPARQRSRTLSACPKYLGEASEARCWDRIIKAYFSKGRAFWGRHFKRNRHI